MNNYFKTQKSELYDFNRKASELENSIKRLKESLASDFKSFRRDLYDLIGDTYAYKKYSNKIESMVSPSEYNSIEKTVYKPIDSIVQLTGYIYYIAIKNFEDTGIHIKNTETFKKFGTVNINGTDYNIKVVYSDLDENGNVTRDSVEKYVFTYEKDGKTYETTIPEMVNCAYTYENMMMDTAVAQGLANVQKNGDGNVSVEEQKAISSAVNSFVGTTMDNGLYDINNEDVKALVSNAKDDETITKELMDNLSDDDKDLFGKVFGEDGGWTVTSAGVTVTGSLLGLCGVTMASFIGKNGIEETPTATTEVPAGGGTTTTSPTDTTGGSSDDDALRDATEAVAGIGTAAVGAVTSSEDTDEDDPEGEPPDEEIKQQEDEEPEVEVEPEDEKDEKESVEEEVEDEEEEEPVEEVEDEEEDEEPLEEEEEEPDQVIEITEYTPEEVPKVEELDVQGDALNKDYDQMAIDEYMASAESNPELDAAKQADWIQEFDDLYRNNPEQLRQNLKEMGYSDNDIAKMIAENDDAYFFGRDCYINGKRNMEIANIAKTFAEADGVTNFDTRFDDTNSGLINQLGVDYSGDATITDLSGKLDTASSNYKSAFMDYDNLVDRYKESNNKIENFRKMHGSESSWTQAQADEWNSMVSENDELYKNLAAASTTANENQKKYLELKQQLAAAKASYVDKLIKNKQVEIQSISTANVNVEPMSSGQPTGDGVTLADINNLL